MPIETKPEEKTISGPELTAALTDAVQRMLGKRVDPKTLRVSGDNDSAINVELLRITCEIAGPLKGPKTGAKRGPRKPKDKSASAG